MPPQCKRKNDWLNDWLNEGNITHNGSQECAAPKATPQKIIVHLSNSEGENALQAALMGIGLATALRQRGAQVTLMLDASALNLARTTWCGKGLAPAATAPVMPPMSLGAVRASFVRPGSVVPGAQIAGEGELAQIVFDADKILDY